MDIRTLSMVSVTCSLLEVIALLYLYLTNKPYKGITWWAGGFLTATAGYLLIWLRDSISSSLVSIILTNLLLVLGPTFQYIGIRLFLNKTVSRPFLITVLTVFVLTYLYFTYPNEDVALRGIILSLTLAIFGSAAGLALMGGKSQATATSTYFLSLTFLVYCTFNLVRTVILVISGQGPNIFDPTLIQLLTFLVSFFVGILLTFGYILLVNQRVYAEMRQAKEDFEVIFSTGPDAITLTRLSDGKILKVNEGYQALSGKRADEVVGKNAKEASLGLIEADRLKYYRAIEEKGSIDNFESTLQHPDGRRIAVLLSGKVIKVNDIPCIVSIIRDISAIQKINDQLKEANQLFSTVANSSSSLFWMSGLNRDYFWFNDSWLKFTGRKMAEETGDGWQADVHPDELDNWLKTYHENFDKRISYIQEYRLRHNDGTYHWIVVQGVPRYDYNGQFAGYIGTCFDITKRKTAEEKLQESEKKYRLLIESANDAIVVVQDTLFKYVNPSMIKLLGSKSENELIGASFTEIIYSDDLNMVIENYRKRMQKIQVPRYDFRMLTHNREIKWVQIVGVLIEWEGRPASLNFLVDITEHKLAEEKLKESENKYRLLIENANDSILVVQDRSFKFVNPMMVKLLELKTEEEIIGQPIVDYIYPEDRDLVVNNYTQRIKNEAVPSRYNFRVITSTGSLKWVEINAVLIDWKGRPATLNLLTDITERRQADLRLLLSRDVLRILNEAQNVADTIEQILTAIKNETGCDAVGVRLRSGEDFPYFKQQGFSDDFLAAENSLLRREPESAQGQVKEGKLKLECACGQVISGLQTSENQFATRGGSLWSNDVQGIGQLAEGQHPRTISRDNCARAGYQSVALIPIRTNDQIVGLLQLNDRRKNRFSTEMIEFFEGISASIGVAVVRKQNRDTLNAAYDQEKKLRQQLENEAQARMQFINVLAHELKGPLTPIMASSEMLKEELLKNPNKITQRLANNIVNGTRLLLNRLEELLEVARFARGTTSLNLKPTNLRQFFEQATARYEPSITRRKQPLIVEIAADLPVAQIDASRLEQVLINLLSNASKYSPEGSPIRLTARVVQNELQVSIQDQGIGISAEDQASLFQPYQRLGQDKQKIEGLGLGLTVVKYIVELHGGKIRVDSQLGQGSTFTFTIPLNRTKRNQEQIPATRIA
jgi:PAS domain S-box-containing protein